MKKSIRENGSGTVRRIQKEEREWELVLVTAIMALLAALGMVLSFAAFTGADIFTWEPVLAVSIYFVLSGVIWGILIIKNC